MTTSTIRSRWSARHGFTLAEVIMASTIAILVLTAVLTSFLLLGRSGANIVAYSRMESQARRALEEFSQDLRMASAITWNSATSITLTLPDSHTVTYAYDPASLGATAKSFYRKTGAAGSTDPRTVLVQNVATFAYARFDRLDNAAAQDTSTKRIQLTMTSRTTQVTVAEATNNIISASYILRNKPVN